MLLAFLTQLCRDLSENKLTEVPPCIGRLTSLNQLDLHSNSIQQLPEELGQLKKVRQVNASILYLINSAAQTPTHTHP